MRTGTPRPAARSTAWLAAVCAVVTVVAACTSATAPPRPTRPHSASPPTAGTTAQNTTPPVVKPSRDPAEQREQASAKIAEIERHEPRGSISVAAMNVATGARFVAGQRSGMWTASAYKLFVLETLLLQRGGALTGYEDAEAEQMIENSDNKAGYSLFLAAGGNAGLDVAARRFGMTHTRPGDTDPTFTTTCAADFLTLARNLVVAHGPLTPSARKYALSLMADVEADQRWGVSAVADKDSKSYNKNGWLSIDDSNAPGETDNGRWAVTSVGIVHVHHQQVLMSIFTQHQPLMGDGVRLIERLARAIAPAVAS